MNYRRPTSNGIDRLPPHSIESEMFILGACLTDPNKCMPICIQSIGINGDAFYDLRHQTVYKTLVNMSQKMKPINLVSVTGELKDTKLYEQIGGYEYLNLIFDACISSADLEYQLNRVIEKYTLRQMIQACTGIVGRIFEFEGNADALIEEVERDILSIRRQRTANTVKPIKELVKEALVDIERMFQSNGQITGMSTGFVDLDMETDGMHPGDYILIAAFPSVGKTSLAMNIAEHVALELGHPVGILSAEMSALSLVKRSLSSLGRINLRDIRDGKLSDSDFPRLMTASGRLSASHIHIDDTSDLTTDQVRAKARRMAQQHGIKLLIGDFAQLFSSPNAENRTNEIDQVSKCFKQMAKELNIPVILLSQLTEDKDGKGDGKLKGARALGEDADKYFLLKRPKNAQEDPEELGEVIELWIKKNRNGPRNVCIPLTFLKCFTRYESRGKVQADYE